MKYLFGPVASRRFGRSLGINVIPHKYCTYDCIYCETGKTTNKIIDRMHFFNIEELIDEFISYYYKNIDSIDIVTITGQGEPTLNVDLELIIDSIKQHLKHPLLVLTNGSLLYDENVQKSLYKADIVCASLDAAIMNIFLKINRPHKTLNIEKVINGLIDFSYKYTGKLLIEILLVKNINDSFYHLEQLYKIIKKCKYYAVQLNTVIRPPAYKNAKAETEEDLYNISKYMEMLDIKLQNSYNVDSNLKNNYLTLADYIINIAAIRPISIADILKIVDSPKIDVVNTINELIVNGKVTSIEHSGCIYYISK